MALRRRPKPTGGEELSLTECPLPWCEAEFGPDDRPAIHLHRDHTPGEFGLTPLRGGAGA